MRLIVLIAVLSVACGKSEKSGEAKGKGGAKATQLAQLDTAHAIEVPTNWKVAVVEDQARYELRDDKDKLMAHLGVGIATPHDWSEISNAMGCTEDPAHGDLASGGLYVTCTGPASFDPKVTVSVTVSKFHVFKRFGDANADEIDCSGETADAALAAKLVAMCKSIQLH